MSGQQFPTGLFGAVWLTVMPTVEMTSHLYQFFPALENRTIKVPAGSVAEILRAINEIAPGFTDYVLDERGALRRHVNLSINDMMVIDRKTLADHVSDEDVVYIFQALSGG
jgi:sulfur carrier protein ThiS